MREEKVFIINLNPGENPDIGYLKMGLLFNPFPKVALGIATGPPKRDSRFYEMDVKRHLRAGVTLQQARSLLSGILSEEAKNIALGGMKDGDRREVIITTEGEGGELLRRDLTN